MRAETTSNAKSLDKELSKIQTFAIAPLTVMLENMESLANQDLQLATTGAIQLIGNANTKISRLRREKIVRSINKSLLPLVKDDQPYINASLTCSAPILRRTLKTSSIR